MKGSIMHGVWPSFRSWRVIGLLMVWTIGLCGCHGSGEDAGSGPGSYRRLVGQWQRPDGGYVLDIKAAGDGMMEAAYFNPRPIHVANARASHSNGQVRVRVELRDINYPGSTYDLAYDSVHDRLVGSYYQAVERKTYAIQFVRVNP
jgi:hypothetical protein